MSPTQTATATITDTATTTATSTPTGTPCTASSLQASYNFNGGMQCWGPDAGSLTYITACQVSTSVQHGGNDSLQVGVNNTSASSQQLQVEVNLSTPQNLCGDSVTLWVYVDSSLYNSSEAILIFDQNSGYTNFENSYSTVSSGGTWLQFVHNGLGDQSVIQLGVMIQNIPAGASGNFYIADVNIAGPPTPIDSWDFSDGAVDNWAQVYPTGTLTVASISGFPAPCNSSAYGLDAAFPVSGGDIQIEVNNGPIVGSGMNWGALGISTIQAQYYVDATVGDYASTIYPYVTANGNKYGGTYGGWTSQCNGSCPYVAHGAWNTVAFTPSGGTWSTDKSNVTAVGVNPHLSSATGSGNIYIGKVILY